MTNQHGQYFRFLCSPANSPIKPHKTFGLESVCFAILLSLLPLPAYAEDAMSQYTPTTKQRFDWTRGWDTYDTAGLIISTVPIVIDWGQTLWISHHYNMEYSEGSYQRHYEGGLASHFIGHQPSRGRINVYFPCVIAINALAQLASSKWIEMPDFIKPIVKKIPLRNMIQGGVTVSFAINDSRNFRAGVGIKF